MREQGCVGRTTATDVVLEAGNVAVRVALDPLEITVTRDGRRLLHGLRLWAADGRVHDQFIQLTEGVIPREELDEVQRLERARPIAGAGGRDLELTGQLPGGQQVTLQLSVDPAGRVSIEARADPAPLRLGVEWDARPGEHFTG